MATNADFDALIVRIDTATITLENNVQTLTEAGTDVAEAVAEAQGYANAASSSATAAAGSVTAAATQASNAAASASTASTQAGNALTQANRAQQIADDLLNSAPFQEAPEDGQTYGRNNGAWTVVSGGGGEGTVQSVNNIAPDEDGNVTLAASDVGAKPSSYVPTWSEVTGKPTTFPPSAHTHNASDINAGTLDVARIPSLPASQVTSGTFATARLGTGTASSTTVLRGDGTWGSAPAANMGLDKSNIQMYGSAVTAWPFSSIWKAVKLDQVQNASGTVVGGAFFASTTNINTLPAGVYAFDSNDFASGSNLNGKGGFIIAVSGEISAVGNFQTRAFAFVDMAFTAGTIGEFYIWKNDGTWVRVNGNT